MWPYRILFTFDVLVLLLLGYFFLDGLQYSQSASYMAIWLPILAVPIALLAGGWHLRARGKTGAASLLLGLLAIGPILFIAFYGLLIATGASWH